MRRNNNKFLKTVLMLLTYHILALVMLSGYRLIELAFLHKLITDPTASVGRSLLNGVWFDNVVVCYIMIVPLVIMLIAASLGRCGKGLRKATMIWVTVLVAIVMMASAANTPYFDYFGKNINSSIFQWFGYPGTTMGMILQEKTYWIHIGLYIVLVVIYILLMRWLNKFFNRLIGQTEMPFFSIFLRRMAISLPLIALCIFGIRGRTGYNPIKISEAYYCDDPFLNQLGINPAFNLLTSSMDDMRPENRELGLMPTNEAITFVRSDLGITDKIDSTDILRRYIKATRRGTKPNVVFILMESMSASLLNTFGGQPGLTPQLDSLYHHSLAFTNFFSAGIHTNHGITASLYSFPAIMFRNLMKGTVTPQRHGIPTVLKQEGYHNMFFMTHEAQYDNMKAFLTTNGYDDIYSQETYPKDSVVNSFGVSDHFEFNFALAKIDNEARRHRPFMATILTISNHPPYIIPPYFKPKTKDPETQIVEYADWSIKDFIHKAYRRPWFKNTIFVILADHGKRVGTSEAELQPSYNHIPLIIFGRGVPTFLYKGLATQVDIMPTLLGLMGMSYSYDGFGYDLMKHLRSTVFYSADNQIVGRDKSLCYIYNPKENKNFYYRIGNKWSMNETKRSNAFAPLRHYAFAMEQTAQWMIKKQETMRAKK
jgi:phosphoglycerol transferase MdoB-like AlkP superfamily enzyme